MAKRFRTSIFLVLFISLFFSPSLLAGKKTLRWAHYIPNRPNILVTGDELMAKRVEELTNGEIKIKIYFGQTLGKIKELKSLVQSGTVDIASFPTGYFSSAFPLWTAPNNLPFVMDTTMQAYDSAIELTESNQAVQREIESQNLKLLFHHVLPPYQLFSKKPIAKFEDLNGLKIRTWGAYMPRAYKAAGAVAVNVFPAEVYEALKRGVVDAAMWPLELGMLQRHYEVAPNVCMWNVGAFVGWGNWINLKTWNRLSASQKAAFEQAAREGRKNELDMRLKMKAVAMKKLVAAGANILEIPEIERQKWIDASPDFLNEWVSMAEEKGLGQEARGIKKQWQAIITR